jgi:hypothetical protein
MAEMPLAGERDDEFEFLDHVMGPGSALSWQEEATSAISKREGYCNSFHRRDRSP